MKLPSKMLIIISFSSPVFGFDYISGNNISKWDIGGEIEERCIVETYDTGDRSTTLDLSKRTAQTTASVSLWCNTRNAKAKTTYSSTNGGVMVNENGDEISYVIDVGNNRGLDLKIIKRLSKSAVTVTMWVIKLVL